MKRLLTYIMVASFALVTIGGNALAVEKKTKKKTTTSQKKTPVKKGAKGTKGTKGSKKKYDTFIDKNKNGIDDRRENLKSTKGKKKTAQAKKAATKKTSTKKAAAKKKSDPKKKKP